MAVCLPITAFFLVKFHTVATQKNKNKNSFAKCTKGVLFFGEKRHKIRHILRKKTSEIKPRVRFKKKTCKKVH
jgi:hypothetical protein